MSAMPSAEQALDQLVERIQARGVAGLSLIGIARGGVLVARRLQQRLGLDEAPGELNISYHRDDVGRRIAPAVQSSHLPFAIEDRDLLLVDDVLQSGRTIRAALNEIFDWGRPRSVQLAVLVARPERELPIDTALVGCRVDLAADRRIQLLDQAGLLQFRID